MYALQAESATRELFEGTTTEQRMKFAASRPTGHSVNQGYFPHKKTAEIHPDLVHGWVFTRRAFRAVPCSCGPHADKTYSPPVAAPGAGADAEGKFWPRQIGYDTGSGDSEKAKTETEKANANAKAKAEHVEQVLTKYTLAMEKLIPKIMRAMLTHLMIKNTGTAGTGADDSSIFAAVTKTMAGLMPSEQPLSWALRLNYYPAIAPGGKVRQKSHPKTV